MTTTTNLGLKKPENSDYADVSVLNENMDKLDETIPNLTGNALKEASTKSTPADDDGVVIVDSADSSKIKRILWSKIKALFAPKTHASQHSASGSDPVTPESIGAVKKTGDTMTGQLNVPAFVLTNYNAALEIGKNIDFHAAGSTNDYDARLAYDSGALLFRMLGGDYKTMLHTGNLSDFGVAKIEPGTYVGTGTYGASNPCSLTFGFVPKMVFIIKDNAQVLTGNTYSYSCTCGFLSSQLSTEYKDIMVNPRQLDSMSVKLNDKTLYWYKEPTTSGSDSSGFMLNASGITYHYIAIG